MSICAGARLDASGRTRLFQAINQGPTLFEIVMGQGGRGGVGGMGRNRQEPVRLSCLMLSDCHPCGGRVITFTTD